MSMFCYQCQETAKNEGCTVSGVCGKNEEVANLQDLLIFLLRGISFWGVKARELGKYDEEIDLFIAKSLFLTITNVNFDPDIMVSFIDEAFSKRDWIKSIFLDAYKEENGTDFISELPDAALWFTEEGKEEYFKKSLLIGVLSEENHVIRSLKWTIIIGLKGIAAYVDHAAILKYTNTEIFEFLQEALVATLPNDLSIDDLIGFLLKTGEFAVKAMALLDEANTTTYGHPEITQVYTGTEEGPAILISGHDLLDLEELLKQTEDKGVNIYTHGEMLPANAYPAFKKFSQLKGNYGTAWWAQNKEFPEFNGAILMTTNCITRPKDSYKDRIFTTGLVGWPDVKHIPNRADGNPKDFSEVIEKAISLGGLKKTEGKKITIGFAHNTALQHVDAIVAAVKSGAVKRFFVMSGCDGRHPSRKYYTELAEKLPKDTIILTSGCAKYRYNMLDLGTIGGIPRVLDAGQCNDSYSVVLIANKLVEAFGVESINDLPVSMDIAWYEQKAVCIFLALLYLGVKGIRVGPTLPAFLSPEVINVLVENFGVKPITNVDDDIMAMMEGK